MIQLTGTDLTTCKSFQSIVESKVVSKSFTDADIKNLEDLKFALCDKLGVKPDDYLLDAKCGTLVLPSEAPMGITSLSKLTRIYI